MELQKQLREWIECCTFEFLQSIILRRGLWLVSKNLIWLI